jgi:hypothetical protein
VTKVCVKDGGGETVVGSLTIGSRAVLPISSNLPHRITFEGVALFNGECHNLVIKPSINY